MTHGSADLFGQALLAGAAVVEAGQLIQRRELVDLIGQAFDSGEGLDLIGQLIPHANDHRLLVNHVNAEDEDDSNESSHGLVEIERVRRLLDAKHLGECKRRHGDGQQSEDEYGGGPQPPLAAVERPQVLAERVRPNIRSVLRGIRFNHCAHRHRLPDYL